MAFFRLIRRNLAPALAAALILRALVPVGYMPAAAGSGFLFELCPEGMPAELMQLLSGDTGHSHHHGDDGAGDKESHECSIGHLLLSAAATDSHYDALALRPEPALYRSHAIVFASTTRTAYHSRGPPA